ncbi:MAG: Tetratricopeptide TPR_1 repeat-containing protein [Candidatus Gottesmanbacteria bacterium GW2011_GWA1_34_13]|uniref:Tetratricopeptide TPR_1 repeat-containing protein n=1 Tax=Candidatus Gottesmanbacteria bacterium GW2011_GWA1_34_13 TaxID=1618434 RepID=A0A0G0ASA5_9BACT|nr:MAG: Tetratricopeptide TPR_1 repeat-containing protein [Candidatus Gottesmanbacteria bacterium GW2011_GWA1_34_13]
MPVLIFSIFIFILFFKSLFVYFVQDDFYFLAITRIHTFSQFFSLFIPDPNNVWYRPLSSPVFFYLLKLLFGYNPFGFHLIVFVTHVFTIWLLYFFIKTILKNNLIALLSGLFYGIHQLHTVSLSWLATYPFILGPTMLLLTLIFFYKQKIYLSLLFFIFGLLSWEIIVIVPIILILFTILIEKQKKFLRITPFICLSVLLVIVRLVIFKTEVKTNLYSIQFSWEIISLFKFYLLRLVGLPMLITEMPNVEKIITLLLSGFFTIITIYGFYLSYIKRHLQKRIVLFLLLLMIIGIGPFLFLPNHIAPHYLSVALIGYAILSAYGIYEVILNIKHKKIISTIIILIFVINQYIGIDWTYKTHWIFQRAVLAKKLIENNQLIQKIGTEEYFSLGGENGYTALHK